MCLIALPDGCLAARDLLGRVHWLEILDEAPRLRQRLDATGFPAVNPRFSALRRFLAALIGKPAS